MGAHLEFASNLHFANFQKHFPLNPLTKWHCIMPAHAPMPLSCNNISWNTGNLLFPGTTTEPSKSFATITGNYAEEQRVQKDCSKWLAE